MRDLMDGNHDLIEAAAKLIAEAIPVYFDLNRESL
jgi:hypothetical protein